MKRLFLFLALTLGVNLFSMENAPCKASIKAPPRIKTDAHRKQANQLVSAARNGQIPKLTKLLGEKHFNINAQDLKGDSALHSAARNGHLAAVEFLLNNGAFVDIRNDTGLTPLHSAAINGHIEIAMLLLDRGADINAVDALRGRSPLMWVGRMTEGAPRKEISLMPIDKSIRFINLLIERGADPNIVDLDGKTALDWTLEFKIIPIVEILRKAMEARPATEQDLFKTKMQAKKTKELQNEAKKAKAKTDAIKDARRKAKREKIKEGKKKKKEAKKIDNKAQIEK